MTHFVIQPLWKEFCDIIVRTARRADRELADATAVAAPVANASS
jgi:hypothetical protein